jgi:ribosome-binding factor A
VSRRTERVASLIRSMLAEAIQTRLSDPRLSPFTSITRVDVSADLSIAHVHVSVMEQREAQRLLSVRALQSAAGRLRRIVARGLTTRTIPRLQFHLDESVQRSFQTVQIIDRAMRELNRDVLGSDGHAPGPQPAEAPEADQDDQRENV